MRIEPAKLSSRTQIRRSPKQVRELAAFTLIEVVIAALIVGLVFGGIINCYIQSGQRVEWTGYSQAAQSMAIQVIEQARAATWNPAATPPKNQVMQLNLSSTNYNSSTATFTGYSTGILDLPYSTTNFVMATNYVTVQMINNVGNQAGVQMQFVEVQTVWPFNLRKQNLVFTNTVATMMGPDDRAF